MNKMSFFKGMGVGLAVGAAAGMLLHPKKSRAGSIGRALRSVGGAIENVAGSLGLG